VKALAREGHDCVVYDNLSRGHREFVKWGRLIEGDVRDAARLSETFANHRFDAVLHFAALAYVGESVQDPGRYYDVNVNDTRTLSRTHLLIPSEFDAKARFAMSVSRRKVAGYEILDCEIGALRAEASFSTDAKPRVGETY
jgi:nucleoside-diphosphate-sugar epimerase